MSKSPHIKKITDSIFVKDARWTAKQMRKEGVTLMQAQHELAKIKGYKSWKELIDKNK